MLDSLVQLGVGTMYSIESKNNKSVRIFPKVKFEKTEHLSLFTTLGIDIDLYLKAYNLKQEALQDDEDCMNFYFEYFLL